ncbi:MAG: hypothetical protein IJO68_01155 [Clostridia bacterium]|nr:hypothetical protein [Clostridia bacterium]
MKKLPSAASHRVIKLTVSAAIILILSAICFIFPLRPTAAEIKDNKLTEFPEFTVSALTSGDWFSDISLWFSDTVPFRDTVKKIRSGLSIAFGDREANGLNESVTENTSEITEAG